MRFIAFLSICFAHTFTPGLGPCSVCMHCLRVPWALDLGTRFSHYLFPSLHHFISSHLPYPICCSLRIIFYHPEWWSSSVHYMEGSHVISTIYPTDTDPGILSLRGSSHHREFMLHWYLRACLFVLVPSLDFWKKKKVKSNKSMCVLFSIIGCVYQYSRVIWSSMFVDGSSYVSFSRSPFALYSFYHIFCERDEWPSLRSSGSLSIPSLHS